MSAVEVPVDDDLDVWGAPGSAGVALRWFETLLDDDEWDGPETAGDRVVRLLRRGHWPVTAAAAAGLDVGQLRETLREARRVGAIVAQAAAAADAGEEPPDGFPLTRGQEAVLEFGRAVAAAKAHDEIESADAVRRRVVGEAEKRVRTQTFTAKLDAEGNPEIDGDGKPVMVLAGEVLRVEELPPEPVAGLDRLSRLYPERWSKVDKTETSVSGQVTVQLDAEDLVNRIRARMAEHHSKGEAIDTGAVEVPSGSLETQGVEHDEAEDQVAAGDDATETEDRGAEGGPALPAGGVGVVDR